MTITKKKKRKQKPAVDTCVLSHKRITQKHIDDKKVIDWGKGHAFISAIKKTVSSPPVNPLVITGSDLDEVSIRFEAWHFPFRIKMLGKEYTTFPSKIYLHNAEFRLTNSGINFTWLYSTNNDGKTENDLPETEDQCIRTGVVTYVKKLPPPVDKPDKK